MANKWTQEQEWAIKARGGTLLVSAAAGSGKTAVLVERVVDILCDERDNTDADTLLIATFTRAAAAELRSRLTKRLSERISEVKEPAARLRLRRQQLLLQKAQIGTIHSFCGDCLREFFAEAGVTPDFRIMVESPELSLLRQETAQQLAEECFEKGSPEFTSLLDLIGEDKSDGAVEKLILAVDQMVSAFVSPDDKLTEIAESYKKPLPVSDKDYVKWLLAYACAVCAYLKRLLERCLSIAASLDGIDETDLKNMQEECDDISRLIEVIGEGDWDNARSSFNQFAIKSLTKKSNSDSDEIVELKRLHREIKELYRDKFPLQKLFAPSAQSIADDDINQATPIGELCRLVGEYRKRFAGIKRERHMLDPDDLEHMTAALLTRREGDRLLRTDIARTVGRRYKYILLDEYQDTNYTQDVIFRAISREDSDEIDIGDNVFMVGDVKQSIYRFRKAVPKLFMDRMKSFAPYDPNAPRYPAKIILGANFRSRPEVTGTVNFIFSQLMTEQRGGIEYSDGQQLFSKGGFAEASDMESELHIISAKEREEDETGDIVEARYCARMIKRMVEEGFQVSCKKEGEPALRPAEYGDFCIMRRSVRGGHGDAFISQMAELGIPIAIGTDSGFYAAPEVQLMLSLLRSINNPLNDVALTAVLLSPIFGFDGDMLAQLREYGRNKQIYHCLIDAIKEQDELAQTSTQVLAALRHFKKLACVTASDRLISELYRETGLLAAVQAMPGGAARKENLLQLQEQAREFESSGFKGLTRFIRMTDRIIEQGKDKETALVASQSSVSVRTIHSAKGLQFPVCIICGLGSSNSYNSGSSVENNIKFSSALGLGAKQRDGDQRVRYDTARYSAIKFLEENEEVDERLRVLYVAMTRPVDKLIMVATVSGNSSIDSKVGSLPFMIGKNSIGEHCIEPVSLKIFNYCDNWIMACAARHRNAEKLRSLAGLTELPLLKDEAPLKVFIPDESDDLLKKSADTAEWEGGELPPSRLLGMEEQLRRRMDFSCGERLLQDVPAKVTASGVHRHKGGNIATARPSFAKKGELTPTEKGTALHRFMQFCDFERSKQDAGAELARLLAGGFLSEREGKAVGGELPKIEAFFANIAELLAGAEQIEREWRFTAELQPELYGLFMPKAEPEERTACIEALKQSGKSIVIQGECDLLLIMKGEAVVIDYKTDHVTSGEKLVEEYKAQVELYAGAVKAVTGLAVKRCYLYSFELGRLLRV